MRLGDQGDHVDGGLPAAADLFIYGLKLDDVSNSLSMCTTCTLTGPTLRALRSLCVLSVSASHLNSDFIFPFSLSEFKSDFYLTKFQR